MLNCSGEKYRGFWAQVFMDPFGRHVDGPEQQPLPLLFQGFINDPQLGNVNTYREAADHALAIATAQRFPGPGGAVNKDHYFFHVFHNPALQNANPNEPQTNTLVHSFYLLPSGLQQSIPPSACRRFVLQNIEWNKQDCIGKLNYQAPHQVETPRFLAQVAAFRIYIYSFGR